MHLGEFNFMKEFKHIITSGCSFSDKSNKYTWPLHLSESYGVTSNHMGLCSQGNGLIARKAVYAVQLALQQGYNPEELLVGIMWSGHDRHDVYFQNLSHQIENHNYWLHNPTHLVENDPGGWLIMNYHWTEQTNQIYYAHLHDYVHQRVLSFEKILWVQNYFENLGIKYFMTDFMNEEFSERIDWEFFEKIHLNPNITWLKNLVDKTGWLPVNSMHEWCKAHFTADKFPINNVVLENGIAVEVVDSHPPAEMHKKFVMDVILPFIKEKFPEYHCPEFKAFSSQ
jgi:hypothetical protein